MIRVPVLLLALAAGGARAVTFGAWVPDFDDGFATFRARVGDMDSISLFYYSLSSTGAVIPPKAGEHRELIGWAQARGVTVWATVGGTPPTLPAAFSGAAGERAAAELAAVCERFGFDGIDLDFEGINRTARDAYTVFVRKLAATLHGMARPRRLAVTVQDFPSAEDEASMAFDYAALGAAADEVRVMCYDYSYDKPGPLMPRQWYCDILSFAGSRIPPGKFIAALPWYGRDWTGGGPEHEDLLHGQIEARTGIAGYLELLARHGATPSWDEEGGEYWFAYEREGKRHTVWMPEHRKFAWMAEAAVAAGAAGLYVWHLAYTDPASWEVVRAVRGRR